MSFADLSLVDVLTTILLAVGGFFVFVGGVGAIRMPDLFTRMHAASLTDTMGSVLILTGLMLQAGFSLITLKLLAVLVFLVFTSPVSSYALANAASLAGLLPKGIAGFRTGATATAIDDQGSGDELQATRDSPP